MGSRGPSPAAAVAFLALVCAIGGYAVAAPPSDKGNEVIVTTATGAVETSDTEPVEVPFSFDQKAGESLLIAVTGDFQFNGNAETTGCAATVEVLEGSGPDTDLVIDDLNEKLQAGPNKHTGSVAFPAPETDTTRTLTAVVRQVGQEPGSPGTTRKCVDLTVEPPVPVDDNWTVSLRMPATRLR